MDESWAQLGERIDKGMARFASKPVASSLTFAQKRAKHEAECRARELYVGRTEAQYEAAMTERIRTEGSKIREENLERMRMNECGQSYREREVKLHRLPDV